MGYTKLFGEILYSTIWQEPDHVRLVWITMLALKDERHQVMASVPGLAQAAHVTREQCEDALQKFMSPDPDSRSQDFEGRRIEKVDGGWELLNGEHYRKKQSIEERKNYQKEWVREKRAKLSTSVADFDKVDTTEQNRTDHNRTEQKNIYSAIFEHFWKQYPRRLDKERCFKIWQKLKLDALSDTILSALETQKNSEQWLQDAGRFIPHPSTWLNQKRWDQEVDVAKSWVDNWKPKQKETL